MKASEIKALSAEQRAKKLAELKEIGRAHV